MKWKTKSGVSTSGGCQCHIKKKFGDNIFSWEPGLLSKIQAKCYWFILFCTLLAASLYIYIYIYIHTYIYTHTHIYIYIYIRCYFVQNTRKLIDYLRNISEKNYFFLFFIVRDIFSLVAKRITQSRQKNETLPFAKEKEQKPYNRLEVVDHAA